MRIAEKITPTLAAASALTSLACCLPLGGALALGLGSVVAALGSYQTWLLPASGLLIFAGGLQVWRSGRVCGRTSRASLAVLGLSAVVVLLIWFTPQLVAGFLTDWLA